MIDSEIQVGDCLRVMTWDELVDKFGITSGGKINSPIQFEERMDQVCGQIFTIKSIERDPYGLYFRSVEEVETYGFMHSNAFKIRSYWFSDDQPTIKSVSHSEFEKIICGM